MKEFKFAIRLLLFWPGSKSYEPRPNNRDLMTKELTWPYLSQFVIHSTDFLNLEVFHNASSGYVVKILIFLK